MPARLGDIVRALARFGVAVDEPSKGSHWKANKPGCRVYTLPAHNGKKTELDDKYIRGMCRALGIDEDEFRALL